MALKKYIGDYYASESVHVDFLINCLEKFRPKPERFTYEWRDCGECRGMGGHGREMVLKKCDECGGLGKVRTKVKRTAHSV